MENPFDRKAENLGNVTGLEHLNVEIPDQGLASTFYLVGLRLYPRPVPVPRHQQHVGQYRQEPVPHADRRAAGVSRRDRHRRSRPRRAARAASGRQESARRQQSSNSRRPTTMSRRAARGATSSACTAPTPCALAISTSASPMSSLMCRPAPPMGSPGSIARFSTPRRPSRTARARPRGYRSASGRSCASRRPTKRSPSSTAITCRSMSTISRGRMKSCKSST